MPWPASKANDQLGASCRSWRYLRCVLVIPAGIPVSLEFHKPATPAQCSALRASRISLRRLAFSVSEDDEGSSCVWDPDGLASSMGTLEEVRGLVYSTSTLPLALPALTPTLARFTRLRRLTLTERPRSVAAVLPASLEELELRHHMAWGVVPSELQLCALTRLAQLTLHNYYPQASAMSIYGPPRE